MSLHGQVAWVTGGSRGIGRAIATLLAREGADIAFNHLADDARAEEVAEDIRAMGRAAFHMSADMGDTAAIRAFARAAEAATRMPDVLVNNAGLNIRGAFETLTEADFDRVMDVHIKGMFLMAQAVYPAMCARGSGRIINIASQLAFKGSPMLTPYCAAKAAIIGFTRSLAYEAAPRGVLVNALAPGPIETDLTASRGPEWRRAIEATLPIGRLGHVDEIAATALLLAGPGGGYYVGACLSPNGGDVMH
jgi:3-oxoacyl-[acyl-carrier protein] reductase